MRIIIVFTTIFPSRHADCSLARQEKRANCAVPLLAVNQDVLGSPARRVIQTSGTEIWVKELKDGSKAIGLFNRTAAVANVELDWNDSKLTGKQTLRDLWAHKDLGTFEAKYSVNVPAHGAVLIRAAQ